MINWQGKRNLGGLHRQFAAARLGLVVVDGVEQYPDEAAMQAIVDGYTLAQAKSDRRAECSAIARMKFDSVTAGISAAEMAGWPILLSEAVAYRAGSTTHPALTAEASIRGITVEALVQKVEGNAAQFQAARAAIAGTDGKKRDEIDALTTFEEVAAYDVAGGWPL